MVSDFEFKQSYGVSDLVSIMRMLRAEGGCPWDREQTHESIRQNMIEEAYEAVDAIDRKNADMLCEELGDVLLQVVFHACMSEESGDFCFDDVADGVCRKLIERHPHVFGVVHVNGSEEVLKNWDAIKQRSKHQKTVTDTMRAVPAAFPALMRAQKVLKRASKSPLYSESGEQARKKIGEYADGCLVCEDAVQRKALAGRMLLEAVALARSVSVDAEECLAFAVEDFTDSFEAAESAASGAE